MRAKLLPLALALTATVAAACAQASGLERRWQRLHTPPPGSALVLNRAVEVPPSEGEVYVQDGRVLPYADVDPFRPHCALELRGAPPVAVTVPPGRYRIVRVVHDEDPNLVRAPARGHLLAGLWLAGGPSQWMYATELYLAGDGPNAPWRLRCGHWEDPSLDPRFLTLDEIRAALGSLATLETP